MKRTDYFGTQKLYLSKEKEELLNNLQDKIIEEGFTDYSKEGISSFFYFRYPILNLTMFKEYQSVDNGVEIVSNQTQNYYWKPTFNEKEVDFDVAIDECEKLLLEGIGELISNKKRIGITLSGGLDSSLILAMVKKHFPTKEVYTYSCGFYGDDEFEYSRLVAELYSDKHTEIVLGKDDFTGDNSILPALIKQKCAPLHPNELGLAVIEQIARKELCDIVLCGEGSDDIFGGYGKNLRMYLNYSGDSKEYYKYIMDEYRYFAIDKIKKIIHEKYFVNDLALMESVFDEKECPTDLKNQMLYFTQRIHTPGLIQRGMNALQFSNFTSGFPFIYPKLVDYVNDLKFDYKVHWNEGVQQSELSSESYKNVSEVYDTPKYILKKLAEKYLPNKIIYRKKYGFPVPFAKWFGDLNTYDLDKEVFRSNDISYLSGWEKFMLINLNTFIEIFNKYKK